MAKKLSSIDITTGRIFQIKPSKNTTTMTVLSSCSLYQPKVQRVITNFLLTGKHRPRIVA